MIADVARKAQEAEEELIREKAREAALEKARKAAESHRLQMRDSFDDMESPEPVRSTSRLSWRDDDAYVSPGPVAPSYYDSYDFNDSYKSYDADDSYDSSSNFGSYDSGSYKSKA